MVEYELDEALEFVTSQLDGLNQGIRQAEMVLDYLKDQITTVEVNIARVYNWGVVQRREQKAVSA